MTNLDGLLAELATLTKSEFGMVQEVTSAYRPRAEEKRLLQFTDKLKKRFLLSLSDESVSNGLPDAFDTMWLPSEAWEVGVRNLLAPKPGIFILRERFC
jgi:hypothetical protein